MEIRRAALADIPGVCACCVAAFKDYIPLIGQTPGPMLEDYCQARKEHFLFVAAQGEIDQKIEEGKKQRTHQAA